MSRIVLKRFLLASAIVSVPLSLYADRFDAVEAAIQNNSNFFSGTSSLIVGYNNVLSASNSGAAGEGLRGGGPGSFTVGKYNTDNGALFAVGNGTGSATATRKNALEVLSSGGGGNGTVNIPGAVSLGGTVAGQTVSIKGAATFNSTLNVTGANALTVGGVPVLKQGQAITIGLYATNAGGGITIGPYSSNAGGGIASGKYDDTIIPTNTSTNTAASGVFSFASGENSKANGMYSFASGKANTANGHSSFALGFGNNTGFGNNGLYTGWHSLALGYFNQSKGVVSMTLGSSNIANNDFSVAVGHQNRTWRYGQTVVGRFNKIETQADPDAQPANQSALLETDEVFVVGGGSANNARKNVMVVKASGETTILGPVILQGTAVTGDIPMFVPTP